MTREFIGLNVEVINKNIQGKIIDETKNMFTIKTKEGYKKIIKKNSKMKFTMNNEKITIEGDKLIARPQDRINFKVK